MTRPQYEALDARGLPYSRPAQIVGELPAPEVRLAALFEAAPAIADKVGLKLTGRLKFGTPVFCAFDGMTRPKAKTHRDAKLLLTMGCDVSLDFCSSYNAEQL